MITDKPINVAAAVLIDNNQVLLAKRRGGYLDNLWEFPGGKLEKGESAEAAAARELKEELDINVIPENTVLVLEHNYPDKTVRLHFVKCHLSQEDNASREKLQNNSETCWFIPQNMPLQELCPADRSAATEIPWKLLMEDKK